MNRIQCQKMNISSLWKCSIKPLSAVSISILRVYNSFAEFNEHYQSNLIYWITLILFASKSESYKNSRCTYNAILEFHGVSSDIVYWHKSYVSHANLNWLLHVNTWYSICCVVMPSSCQTKLPGTFSTFLLLQCSS